MKYLNLGQSNLFKHLYFRKEGTRSEPLKTWWVMVAILNVVASDVSDKLGEKMC